MPKATFIIYSWGEAATDVDCVDRSTNALSSAAPPLQSRKVSSELVSEAAAETELAAELLSVLLSFKR